MRVPTRSRCRHIGLVELFCGSESLDEATALWAHLIDAADRWLQLFKLEMSIDADAPWFSVALSRGFEVEQRQRSRRWRDGETRDNLLLGRTRDGLPRASPSTAPIAPTRGPRRPIWLRPVLTSDAEDFAVLHREESVMRGTLQTPMRTVDSWREILGGTAAAVSVAAEVDGELVGAGVLMPGGRTSHRTYAIGLSVATSHQGRGVGTALMEMLITAGRQDLGAARLELEVDADNAAGHALYLKCGFVDEGVRRMGTWRGDGYADVVGMGLRYP